MLGRAWSALAWGARVSALVLLAGAGCRGSRPATPASLVDVGLSPITAGYRVCAPHGLHACRVRAVTVLGAGSFPVTDIAPSASCDDQEARAVRRCADVGKPYDALNLRCLASQGIFNNLLHDDAAGAAEKDEKQRLTVRCAEGEAWIDLVAPL